MTADRPFRTIAQVEDLGGQLQLLIEHVPRYPCLHLVVGMSSMPPLDFQLVADLT